MVGKAHPWESHNWFLLVVLEESAMKSPFGRFETTPPLFAHRREGIASVPAHPSIMGLISLKAKEGFNRGSLALVFVLMLKGSVRQQAS